MLARFCLFLTLVKCAPFLNEQLSDTALRDANFQPAPAQGSSAWRESLGARGTPCAPGDRRRARRPRSPDPRPLGRARTRRQRPDRTASCNARLHAPRACAPRVPACSARLHAPRACTPHVPARPACLRAPRACTLRASAHLSAHPARVTRVLLAHLVRSDPTHSVRPDAFLCVRYLCSRLGFVVPNHTNVVVVHVHGVELVAVQDEGLACALC